MEINIKSIFSKQALRWYVVTGTIYYIIKSIQITYAAAFVFNGVERYLSAIDYDLTSLARIFGAAFICWLLLTWPGWMATSTDASCPHEDDLIVLMSRFVIDRIAEFIFG